jgi:hypothetical protein
VAAADDVEEDVGRAAVAGPSVDGQNRPVMDG